jgi:hypothetical protein
MSPYCKPVGDNFYLGDNYMAARRLFRFAGSVRLKGMGPIHIGDLTNVTDYGVVDGTASVWPGVLTSGTSTQSRSGVGKGITALINQDRTWIDNMDYGKGAYGFSSSKPANSTDYGTVA